MRLLYDLAAADPRCRFSPYCWRIKMALALKGLAFDTVPVRFTDKALLAFSGQDLVPVLRDGERTVVDSMAIAAYLDEAYPDTRPLLGPPQSAALTGFIRHWSERVLQARLLPLIVLDIHARLAPVDQAYFRHTREARFGRSLEAYAADADRSPAAFASLLAPLTAALKERPFLGGVEPAFADCIVFGAFQWARSVRVDDVLDAGSPVFQWRERMLDLCSGLARQAYAAGGSTG